MKISLVLLTYNEIDGLKGIFKDIDQLLFDEVFAVDGGSTDGTLEFYKEHGVRYLEQHSKGRGEAFRLAMKAARNEHLVFFSPDGNEDTKDLGKFEKYFEEGYDLVIASRMMKGARNEEDDKIFRWRKWANNAFNLGANVAFRRTGKYVTDTINGYRGITKTAFEKIKPSGEGYTIEYQMSIRAMKNRLKIKEFPTHELERIGGESYAKSIPTGLRFIRMFVRELFGMK